MVEITPLGKFFADGRQRPCMRPVPREILVHQYQDTAYLTDMGRWLMVEPIPGPLLPPLKLRYDRGAEPPPLEVVQAMHVSGYCSADGLEPDLGISPEVMKAQLDLVEAELAKNVGKGWPEPVKQVERPPEAILADFLIE